MRSSFGRLQSGPKAIAALVCAALVGAACGGSTSTSGQAINGGVATFAGNQNAGVVSWIFPMFGLSDCLASDQQFIYQQYRPLYWFGDASGLELNTSKSLAESPQYSGNQVTITLKGYQWSDGTPVSSRDVEFWINLLKANAANDWCYYTPGQFPDNVTGMTMNSPTQLTLTLDHSYSPSWFTNTQLSQIIPIPQHVWDKTSDSGSVGDYDTSANGATAVYNYLANASKNLQTYATNPLWQVVDGPFHVSTFRTDGYAELVPNPKYSGTPKPRISKFVMEPFTSDTAEANVALSGGLTYGYLPFQDLGQTGTFESKGYSLVPWPFLGISYVVINYNNPTMGPIFSQAYVRQAMQEMIDQPGWIKAFLGIGGIPTYGPTPLEPKGIYTAPSEQTNQWSYNPTKAISLLQAHGWNVQPNGVTTCTQPGSGPSQCGDRIPQGAKLQFTLDYLTGATYLSQMMQALKSSFSQAGIDVSLTQGSEAQVLSVAVPCKPSDAACSWQAAQWGTPAWSWSNPYPGGEPLFSTGAGVNPGSYSDPQTDAKIQAIEQSEDPSLWTSYVDYLVQQVPDLWIPNTVNQLSLISTKLHGATPQNPIGLVSPEDWYFTS